MLDSLTPETTDAKRQMVEAFHWMIEEYRVSLFAQELGTAVPVSKKRLIRMIREIDRIV